MKRLKLAVIAATVICTFAMPITGYAEERINSVNVRLEMEEFDEWGYPELTAITKSGHYSVNDVTLAAESDSAGNSYENDTDVYVIDLSADDGYYFNIVRADKINISGLGADFIKASRQNNGSNLYVTVRLTGVGTFVGEIGEAKWNQNGYGAWEDAYGAENYMIYLYDTKDKLRRIETGGSSYDFRPYMQKAGNYSFKVRPMSSSGNSGEWVDAGDFTVTEDMAKANKEQFEVKKEVSYRDGIKAPSNEIVDYKNIGWQEAENGRYWYRCQDASYPQETWMQEGEYWYYFGSDGYRKAGEYVTLGGFDYYFNQEGKLLVNTKTPDGRQAGTDGKISVKK